MALFGLAQTGDVTSNCDTMSICRRRVESIGSRTHMNQAYSHVNVQAPQLCLCHTRVRERACSKYTDGHWTQLALRYCHVANPSGLEEQSP